ncbi:MAG: class I SAM-dependent methyltransferase [Magnetospiraceae bacterium]
MTELLEVLRARIAEQGPITLADYMGTALGHPQFGYYSTRDPLGLAGDFITAPEISQVFGELIGLWAAVTWGQIGGPQPLRLVELGPGRGTLMADMLRAGGTLPGFTAAVEVHLVETSAALRHCQERTLEEASVSVTWHESVETLPEGPLVIVANEFFDALPVRQLRRTAEGWGEHGIGLDPNGDALVPVLLPAPQEAVDQIPPALLSVEEGAIVEINPAARSVMHHLAQRLVRFGGAFLAIDYGHAHSAAGDTVQAVKAHEYHPILTDPGTADITAHVDFEALAQEARKAGAVALGPITQRDLLIRLGIGPRLETLAASATEHQVTEMMQAVARLTEDDQMGTLFKALAVTHPLVFLVPGFEGEM